MLPLPKCVRAPSDEERENAHRGEERVKERPSAIEVDRQETQLAVLGTTREGLYTLEEYLSLGRTKPNQTVPAHHSIL